MFVIGDTPHDIHCANAIGARTIAVATGGYTRRGARSASAVAGVRRAAAAGRVRAADRSRRCDPARPAHGDGMKHGIRRFPRCGAPRVWRGAGITPGSTPIRTGGRCSPPTPSAVGVGARGGAGRPARADGDRDRLLRARGHARERAGRGADVPRRRGARAAVRRRDDRLRRVRGVALSRTSRASCSTGRRAICAATASGRPSASTRQLGLTVHRYSDWLTADDRAEARRLAHDAAGRCRSRRSRSTAWPSASTPTPARCGSSPPARSTTSRTARRCCAAISSRRC